MYVMRKLSVLLVAVGLALSSLTATSPTARAVDPPPSTATRGAAGWLALKIDARGFIPNPDGNPNFGNTSQAVIALSAAGFYRNQVAAMEAYLAANAGTVAGPTGTRDPGSLANLILGAVASGRDPRAFGGYDLVATLQSTERTTGPDSGLFGAGDPTYDGAFRQGLSLWALHVAGAGADASATGWLVGQQCAGGGWTAHRADTSVACPAPDSANFDGPDTNSTALALLGLSGQGVTPAVDAKAYLYGVRTSGGGWAYRALSTDAADANSTGLVLQSLIALNGANDQTGLTALRGFQVPCSSGSADRGGVAFQPGAGGSLTPDTMATIQALPALAGRTMGRAADPNSYEEAGCLVALSPNQRWVQSIYQSFLGRQTVGQEINLAYQLDAGYLTRRQAVGVATGSLEYIRSIVTGFYANTLSRPPDGDGLNYWIGEIAFRHRTVAEVGAFFYASDEYYAGFGGGTVPTWVSDLYAKILHRQPDAAGLDYWVNETAANGRFPVALRFFQSIESRQDRVEALYQRLLGRGAEPAGLAYWTDRVLLHRRLGPGLGSGGQPGVLRPGPGAVPVNPSRARGVRRLPPFAVAWAVLGAGVLLGAGAVTAPVAAAGTLPCVARAGEIRVAVVIDFGTSPGSPGGTSQVCVPVSERTDAAALLAARAQQLGVVAPRYNGVGLLCSIDGYPSSGCGESVGGVARYWAYWLGSGSGWSYANVGPAGHQVDGNVVEGWRFIEGTAGDHGPAPRGPSVASDICVGLQSGSSGGAATGGSLGGSATGGTGPGGTVTGDPGTTAGGTTGSAPAGGPAGGTTGSQPGAGPGDVVTLPSLPTATTTTTTVPASSTTATDSAAAVSTKEANRRAAAPARRIKAAAEGSGGGGGVLAPLAIGLVVVLLVLGGVWQARRRRPKHAA